MPTRTNNKANVSTTRGVKGGYLFAAPLGTTGAPTKANFQTWGSNIPAGWVNLGYIPEDGFTESVERDSGDSFRDINLDVVESGAGSATESFNVALMEIAKDPLALQYGRDNVTDEDGVVEVRHNWSNMDDHNQIVALLLLKNGRKWVKYVPDCQTTDLGEFTGNRSTIAQRQLTLTYNTDADGNGCFDWYESTETPVPQLTALSLSGITLSPAFAAGTTSYTGEAAGAATTVTATVGTGKTVSIKSGENNYGSGDSVPLVVGTNKIVVTVTSTDSGITNAYTVTVTKAE
jgi:hypothetical protein